jgi:transcriptional repressor NF-X1
MHSCELVSNENRKLQRTQQLLQIQDDDTVVLQKVDSSFKRTTKLLDCNDECKTLERNRRLDIAFKVENPNLISYPKFIPDYTDFVKTFYKKDSSFVNGIHEKLTELVKLSKDSKQKFRSHSFPVMNRDKRHVVHDLAQLFGVETQAFDAEPNRNIVATASRESVSCKFLLIITNVLIKCCLLIYFLVLATKHEHPRSYAT